MGSKETTTTSRTDPGIGANAGLERGVQLSTSGMNAAANNKYTGNFLPTVSNASLQGRDSFASMLAGINPNYGKAALNSGDYLSSKIMSGGYDPVMYDPTAAIEAGSRPIIQKYTESLLPGFQGSLTQSGAYQGASPGGSSNIVGQQLSRDLTNEVAQVAGTQSLAAADLNSRNRLASNDQINQTIGALPGIYQGGLAAASVLPQAYGQLGALNESFDARSIQEALTRNNYDNNFLASVVGAYQPLLMDPATAFSTNTQTVQQQADPVTQTIQAIAAIGSFFGGKGPGPQDAFADSPGITAKNNSAYFSPNGQPSVGTPGGAGTAYASLSPYQLPFINPFG